MPIKQVRLKANMDIDELIDINYGFYGMNSKAEEGILLKVSKRIPAYIDSIFKQAPDIGKGASILQTVFFTADQIILYKNESFREFILKLEYNGNLANIDEKRLKAFLDRAKYLEPEIDNSSGQITDEYKYVPLALMIDALGSPRAIVPGRNWLNMYRTNRFIHTHLPTEVIWNKLIGKFLDGEKRDELNTPMDILALKTDINKLKAPQGASSSIIMFESDRTPGNLRTFTLDRLGQDEQKELFTLANKHRSSLTRDTSDFYHNELQEIVRFYELVKKATVNGFPMQE